MLLLLGFLLNLNELQSSEPDKSSQAAEQAIKKIK